MTLAEVFQAPYTNLRGGYFVEPVEDELSYRFGPFELRPDGTLLRDLTPIPLPPKELALLRVLLRRAGSVASTDELRAAGWGQTHVSIDSLPRCVSSLRARLGLNRLGLDRAGPDRSISTVYKRGYRFEWPVSLLASVGSLRPHKQSMQRSGDSGDGDHSNQDSDNGGKSSPSVRLRGNPRMVIVPFAVNQGVPEPLGRTIVEETMLHLSQVHSSIVNVLAYDSVSSLHKRGKTAIEIGETLQARFAIAGIVVALPRHFRLRAEMLCVEDKVQLWVEDFLITRDRIDLGVLQMAKRIGDRIQSTVSSAAGSGGASLTSGGKALATNPSTGAAHEEHTSRAEDEDGAARRRSDYHTSGSYPSPVLAAR